MAYVGRQNLGQQEGNGDRRKTISEHADVGTFRTNTTEESNHVMNA